MTASINKSKPILIVGNCVVDQIWRVPEYPTEDQEMRALDRELMLGGNGCNSAQALALLKQPVELISRLADDAESGWILSQLRKLGIVQSQCVQTASTQSPVSCIWSSVETGSRSIIHHRNLPELDSHDFAQVDWSGYAWVHFEGRNIETLRTLLPTLTKRVPCPLSLEIEKARAGIEALLPWVQTVVVSRAYLSARAVNPQQVIQEFSQLNPNLNIVCTLGENGVFARSQAGKLTQLPALPVHQPLDSRGAGDCFIAALIYRLSQGKSLASAIGFANRLAASKLCHVGINFDEALASE